MICEKCGSTHDGTFGSGRFCSRRCANTKTYSNATKQKISESSKASDKVKQANSARKTNKPQKCPMCEQMFYTSKSMPRTYCSKKCYKDDSALLYRSKPLGGYREGSGRAKTGRYRGIYCGSTYELVWVIYRLDHNLPVVRFAGKLTADGLTYVPDFIDGNKIYEIKGYYQQSVDAKCNLAKSCGYDIQVLYKDDLQECFCWVKSNYQYKTLEELYDDHVPQFAYVCSCCGKPFTRNQEIKTSVRFCSRQCSGKGHTGRK